MPTDGQRQERVLATTRAVVALSLTVAVWLDPTRPARYVLLTNSLLGFYLFVSLGIFSYVRVRPVKWKSFGAAAHGLDILWPAVMVVLVGGADFPIFLFYALVLLGAAYRWGLLASFFTAGVSIALLTLPVLLLPSSVGFAGVGMSAGVVLMRGFYLLILAYLLGTLAEEERRLHDEASALARLAAKMQAENSLRGTMRAAFEEVWENFGPRRCVVAIQEASSGRAYVWEDGPRNSSGDFSLTSSEIEPDMTARYHIDSPGDAWCGWREGGGKEIRLLALSEAGKREETRWTPPPDFLGGAAWRSLLAAEANYRQEWTGCLFLLDPQKRMARDRALRFLRAFAAQAAPALYNAHVTHRVRSKAGAAERARVARELHDGVIQSLIGMEMRVQVLRRHPSVESGPIGAELASLQQLLRQEAVEVRELMQQLRPPDVGPRQFVGHLANLITKFGAETGIVSNFVTTADEVDLHPRLCHELARIAQEGLANVRKHSQARHVVVSLTRENGRWRLVIDDDGRGFDFSGRLTQAELDALRKGPVIIKERTRAMGGELVVESRPGRGARIEITLGGKFHE